MKFIARDFEANWRTSFEETNRGQDIFLVSYVQQKRREVTRAEFRGLVEARMKSLSTESARIHIVVGGNTVENLVDIVASLLLGRAVLPLNPVEGPERVLAMANRLQDQVKIVSSDAEMHTLNGKVVGKPAVSESPFILIPTSGSTGSPKIVEQTELGVMTNVDALIEAHALMAPTTLATSLPVFHVNALEFSFFCAMFSELKLILLDRFDLKSLAEADARDGIEIISLAPPLLRVLEQRWADFPPTSFQKLKYVVSAAAPLSVSLAKSFREKSGRMIRQGYGLSETVNFSLLMPGELSSEEHRHWMEDFESPSLGCALRGNEVVILNEAGTELGEGESGEIAIRGANLMRGYRGVDPTETFAEGWFRTGDLGLWRKSADGRRYFFITGRLKDMVKRGAEAIPLREVDDEIGALLPSGWDVIAVPYESETMGEDFGVIVQVIPSSDPQARLKELAEKISSKIPKPLRPSLGLWTTSGLRTPSGKPRRWVFKRAISERAKKSGPSPSMHFENEPHRDPAD